jgi:hypothetical protein
MRVDELIEKLQEMDPSAHVMLEAKGREACFHTRGLSDDENGAFVMLLAGDEIPVTTED